MARGDAPRETRAVGKTGKVDSRRLEGMVFGDSLTMTSLHANLSQCGLVPFRPPQTISGNAILDLRFS